MGVEDPAFVLDRGLGPKASTGWIIGCNPDGNRTCETMPSASAAPLPAVTALGDEPGATAFLPLLTDC